MDGNVRMLIEIVAVLAFAVAFLVTVATDRTFVAGVYRRRLEEVERAHGSACRHCRHPHALHRRWADLGRDRYIVCHAHGCRCARWTDEAEAAALASL